MPSPRAALTVALTATAMLAFAANSLLCRAALAGGHADAVSFTTLRLAGGALALGALARWRGARPPTPRLAWGSAVALFAYAILFSVAYLRIPAGTGALLLFAAVQLTMIGAGLRSGERPRALEWAGLAVSLVGLVLLTRPGLSRPDPTGAALMLGAGAAWGVYSLRGRGAGGCRRRERGELRPHRPRGARDERRLLSAGHDSPDARGRDARARLRCLDLGPRVRHLVRGAAGLSATRAAIVQLSVPPLAALGGVLTLGESVSLRLVLASGLILGGIALAIVGHRRSAPTAA